jgi:hypothetical protein
MTLTFVDDWKRILKRAWSIRLMLLAGLFSGAEVALPLTVGYVDIPPGIFAAMSGLTTGAAFVARLLAQSKLPESQA